TFDRPWGVVAKGAVGDVIAGYRLGPSSAVRMLLSDRVASILMTRAPSALLSSVPTPRPFWPCRMRRPSLITIWPFPRDAPIVWRDTTSHEPSSWRGSGL